MIPVLPQVIGQVKGRVYPGQLWYFDNGRWVNLGAVQNIKIVEDMAYISGSPVPEEAKTTWKLNDIEANFEIEVDRLHEAIGRLMAYHEPLAGSKWSIPCIT